MAAVVVAVAAAAGCGDDDDGGNGSSDTTEGDEGGSGSSVVESAQQLCDSLESLDSTVQDIDVDDETTVGDIKDGLDQLRSEVSDVAESGSALAGALGTALQSAFDRFESEVEDLPEDETLQAAGESARSAADEFEQSWDAAMEGLNCERSSGS